MSALPRRLSMSLTVRARRGSPSQCKHTMNNNLSQDLREAVFLILKLVALSELVP